MADENYRFRDYLKHITRLSSEEVDQLVFQLAARTWQTIDCTNCGNCCREVSPGFDEKDVERLAGHLGMSGSQFASQYLKPAEPAEECLGVMRAQPCPFLKENRCSVYEHRPANCRNYPYLDKPDFTARTLAMIGRLGECPAVFQVWEDLKRATGFRPGRRKRWPPNFI